jgi:hypothetical protein
MCRLFSLYEKPIKLCFPALPNTPKIPRGINAPYDHQQVTQDRESYQNTKHNDPGVLWKIQQPLFIAKQANKHDNVQHQRPDQKTNHKQVISERIKDLKMQQGRNRSCAAAKRAIQMQAVVEKTSEQKGKRVARQIYVQRKQKAKQKKARMKCQKNFAFPSFPHSRCPFLE